MKRLYLFIALFTVIALSGIVQAKSKSEDESHVTLKPGMELKKIGSVNRLVPEGTRVVDKDGLVTTESIGEYVARRFTNVEARIKNIENRVSAIENELKSLDGVLHTVSDQLEMLSQLKKDIESKPYQVDETS